MKADWYQQELLRKFYQEETTWCPEHVGYQLTAGIMIGISMLLGVVPYQVWDFTKDTSILFFWNTLYLAGVICYMCKYMHYAEIRKTKSVFDLLRYLPVSRWQIRIFIMNRVLRLCVRLLAVTVCCQTVFAVGFMHTFSIGNVILPVGVNLLLPVACAWLVLLSA